MFASLKMCLSALQPFVKVKKSRKWMCLKRLAKARPMPLAAPVTTAVFPERSCMVPTLGADAVRSETRNGSRRSTWIPCFAMGKALDHLLDIRDSREIVDAIPALEQLQVFGKLLRYARPDVESSFVEALEHSVMHAGSIRAGAGSDCLEKLLRAVASHLARPDGS